MQGKFSTRIIRVLTDLATITEDMELQKNYIEKALKHLGHSDRKVFSGYLIQLRRYELAYQCFSKEQNPENFNGFKRQVTALNAFFEKNRSSLQHENGMKIFEYEGTVLMADLELKFTNIEEYAVEIFELFKKWDNIEQYINYEVKHKCYSLKFIYFSRRGETALFEYCLQKFIKIGEEHDPTNFRYTLLTMLNTLIRWNLASFILMGLDSIERKFTILTQEESISKMIALDMQRKKSPVLSSCHFIVQDGLSTIAKQLNRITAELCTETWGCTHDAVVLISSTAPLDDIKNYLEQWPIGEIIVVRGQQQSISICHFASRNLSSIAPMTNAARNTADFHVLITPP